MTSIPYPVRINRYLYLKNYCSRRQADRYIKDGKVNINGRAAVLGDIVEKGDKVTLAKDVKAAASKYVYYAFNKPVGIVSHNPKPGEESVEDVFRGKDKSVRLHPLGRLDKASRGLMILSDDGRATNKLLNPKFEHEKEYEVVVDKRITNQFLKHMQKGVQIERYKTKPAKAESLGTSKFRIILTEGKKHQIRRMCAALGYQVRDLKRHRIGNVTLGGLKIGAGRELAGKERAIFLESIGLSA